MEPWHLQAFAYILGTCTGFLITRKLIAAKINELLDHLIEEGFLRSKLNNDGDIIIIKYHDNR